MTLSRWTPFAALITLTALPCLGQPLPPPVTTGYGERLVGGEGGSSGRAASPERGTVTAPIRAEQPVLRIRRSAHGLVALDGPRDDLGWISSPFGRSLSQHGRQILAEKTRGHREGIEETGIGTHYGDHSRFNGLSDAEKRAYIAENAVPGTHPPMPRKSSCIEWAMENVGAAYEAAGRGDRWRQIRSRVLANGAKGTDLAKELEQDGWQAVYWNPDTSNPGSNGEHAYTARLAKNGKPYYGIQTRPERRVINYRAGSSQGMDALEKVPFWFGVAKGGMHTFVGSGSTVSEFHWADNPTSANAIDETPLAEFAWESGVIMVPPGTWQ